MTRPLRPHQSQVLEHKSAVLDAIVAKHQKRVKKLAASVAAKTDGELRARDEALERGLIPKKLTPETKRRQGLLVRVAALTPKGGGEGEGKGKGKGKGEGK